jgi:hypothetical protein
MSDQQEQSPQSSQQPQVITLDNQNSIQFLLQFIEIAQKAGSFLLQESDILKRCKDVLLSSATDPEIDTVKAKQLLIQGIQKGQSKGNYTLEDSSNLFKICQFVNANLTVEPQEDEDLSELSMPVPLRVPEGGPKLV